MSIEAMTLDAAGTLFELVEPVGVVYSRVGKKYGVNLSPESVDQAFRSTWRRMPRAHSQGPEDEREWWRRLVRATLDEASADECSSETFEIWFGELFEFYAQPGAWRLYPDTVPFLEKYTSRVKLAVLSNFDERLQTILQGLGIRSFFETVAFSSRAQASKPDPQIFRFVAKELNLEPSQILHIGDEPVADWQGAQQAGFDVYELRRPDQGLAKILVR